jgi:hypothetical protein
MKFINPKIHGIIDYLAVIFLLASPWYFGFTGILATFTYALAAVHLILTLLTDFSLGLVKAIPFQVHGAIELLVGVVLITLAYTVFKNEIIGKLYYVIFGTVILLTWLVTDYKGEVTQAV